MTIRIDRFGEDRMIVYMPGNKRGKELAKNVHGNSWNRRLGGWTYPLDWQICEEIRKYVAEPLGQRISLRPAMHKWAWEERQRRDEIPDLLSIEDYPVPNLESVNPKLARKARPFQRRGMAFVAKTGRMLLAYDPGLGKTATAIGGIHERGLTGMILVIAPSAAVNISWPLELKQWGTENDYIQIIGAHIKPSERNFIIEDMAAWAEENPDKRVWILMNPYWIRMSAEIDDFGKYVRSERGAKILWAELPALFGVKWAAIIADESHQTLACSTGNAKRWSQQRVGLGALETRPDGILMSISGTPMRGQPDNLYGQLSWLKPQIYKSYWKWIKRHFYMFEDTDDGPPVVGNLKSEEEFYKEASFVLNRLSKEQVAPDLPPKQYGGTYLVPGDESTVFGVWLPMEGKQRTAYNQMVQSASAELDGHVMSADGTLAEYTRLKQFAGSYVEFGGYRTVREVTAEWYMWEDKRREIMNLVELKQAYADEEKFEQADLIHVPKLEDEPERFTGEMVEGPAIYKAMLPSNKFDWILQFLTDRDLVGRNAKGTQKVLIASQFTTLINLFARELEKKDCPNYVLTGETAMSARLKMVEDFQTNPNSPKVFFINTKAGGTAITLDAADDVIICDETFIPDDQLQVEDRAHRLSRVDHTVTIWYLRSLGTIEETIGKTTTEREATCRGILDGSRGLKLTKIRKG